MKAQMQMPTEIIYIKMIYKDIILIMKINK